MYQHASRLVGQRVIVHHQNGSIYHGTLHSVNQQGIYLMNARGNQQVSTPANKMIIQHAIGDGKSNLEISEAFFPFLFLPFVALAGLAAASAWYPYGYGYGYGAGYNGGYYGGYGRGYY